MTERILTSFGVARKSTPGLVLSLVLFVSVAAAFVLFSFKILLAAFAAAFLAALWLDLWVAFSLALLFALFQWPLLQGLSETSALQPLISHGDDLLLVLLALAAPLHARRESWLPREIRLSLVAAAGALAVGFLGTWLHTDPSLITLLDAFSLAKPFLVLFAAVHLPFTEERCRRALQTSTAIALGLAAFGVADLLAPGLTRQWLPVAGPIAWRDGHRCLVSVFANEGMAGWFFAAAACLPLAGWLIRRRNVDLAAMLGLVLASLLTYRRKPVVGLALALAVVLLLQTGRRRLRVLIVVALVLAVGFPLVGQALGESFYQAYLGYVLAPDPMQVPRNALYIASWEIALDHFPVGAGLGLFGGHASTIDYSEFYARYGLNRVWGLTPDEPRFMSDAFYPHIVGGLGFLGALLFAVGLIAPLARLIGAARGGEFGARKVLITGALLVWLEALAEALVAPIFETTLPMLCVCGLVGLALAASRDAGSIAAPEREG